MIKYCATKKNKINYFFWGWDSYQGKTSLQWSNNFDPVSLSWSRQSLVFFLLSLYVYFVSNFYSSLRLFFLSRNILFNTDSTIISFYFLFWVIFYLFFYICIYNINKILITLCDKLFFSLHWFKQMFFIKLDLVNMNIYTQLLLHVPLKSCGKLKLSIRIVAKFQIKSHLFSCI